MTFHIDTCMPDTHAAAVREIFNDAILNTTALYEYQTWTQTDVLKWFGNKAKSGYPVIAAVDGAGLLLGFASYGQFRARPAYKYTVEHSVYVHRDHRRRGVIVRQAGFKFGRWLDLAFYQLTLSTPLQPRDG